MAKLPCSLVSDPFEDYRLHIKCLVEGLVESGHSKKGCCYTMRTQQSESSTRFQIAMRTGLPICGGGMCLMKTSGNII